MKEVYTKMPIYGSQPIPSLNFSNTENESVIEDPRLFDERVLDPRTIQNFEISKNSALVQNNEILNKIAESLGLEGLPEAIFDFNKSHNNPMKQNAILELLAESGKYINNEENVFEQTIQNSKRQIFNR